MGKLVLYLAVSVDGYLADEQGGVGWLGGDGSEPENFGSYPAFYVHCLLRQLQPGHG